MNNKIGLKVKNISNLIRRNVDSRIAKAGLSDITGVQGFIIGYLYTNNDRDIFQRDLEQQFNLRRSSITSVLNNLEKKGYIKREAVDEDKRLKQVVLTNKGIEHQKMIIKIINNYEETLHFDFTDEEFKTLSNLLDKLYNNIKKGENNEKE